MNAVKTLRSSLGMTQIEFANALGKSYGTVQRYEGLRPPRAAALWPLINLAQRHKLLALQRLFEDYMIQSTTEISEDWNQVMSTIQEMRSISGVIPEFSYVVNSSNPEMYDALRCVRAWAACMVEGKFAEEVGPIISQILKVLHAHNIHDYDAIAAYEGVPEIEAAK